jgi:hypothetical protein
MFRLFQECRHDPPVPRIRLSNTFALLPSLCGISGCLVVHRPQSTEWDLVWKTATWPIDFVFCGGLTMGRGGMRFGAGRPGLSGQGGAIAAYRRAAMGKARGYLHGACSFSWSWHRGEEHTGTIGVYVHGPDALTLCYTVQRSMVWRGMWWKGWELLARRAAMVGLGNGSCAPAVHGAWRCCTCVARRSPAGIASAWPTVPSRKTQLTGCGASRARLRQGWTRTGNAQRG